MRFRGRSGPSARRAERGIRAVPMSKLCTQEDLESPRYRVWAERLREPHMRLHRKLWEWCYIADVLAGEDMLRDGRRGLGFAVGHEPLVAEFASRGATILATDLESVEAAAAGWVDSGEHAASAAILNDRGLCADDVFAERVTFRPANMNELPDPTLTGFDFLWSSCAFEHLGGLEQGLRFVVNAMSCLRPGGLAVHTTEFNVGSNDGTIADGQTVIYRQRDIEELVAELRREGHAVDVSFDRGTRPADYHVDVPPYTHDPHLKLHLMGFTTTSIGLAVRCP